MSAEDSVTHWIGNLKAGESVAAARLWERYFHRLVGLARVKLGPKQRAAGSDEDVALSVLKSLCVGAERGQFPQLADRENLWPLLVVITTRKAADLMQHDGRQKRGGGKVLNEQDLAAAERNPLAEVLSAEPSPEFAAIMAEQCRLLLEKLDDEGRRIAMGKMEGRSNAELAGELGVGLRTVERKLELIRRTWDAVLQN